VSGGAHRRESFPSLTSMRGKDFPQRNLNSRITCAAIRSFLIVFRFAARTEAPLCKKILHLCASFVFESQTAKIIARLHSSPA